MRLPPSLLQSPFFMFGDASALQRAIPDEDLEDEFLEVSRLRALGLPAVVSTKLLATMFGFGEGILWSFMKRPHKHYRVFQIPKSRGTVRTIHAPRVGLKIIQKWLATQLGLWFLPHPCVYGFVPGRSHIGAASLHVGADWILSLDIRNFFPSTPKRFVIESLRALGYGQKSAEIIADLTCLDGALSQGSPASPVLSNICFAATDSLLTEVAEGFGVKFSRYADDLTFSGVGDYPAALEPAIRAVIGISPWRIAENKVHIQRRPSRLKVHGLLVMGQAVRLTKGYRNKIRALQHRLASGNLDAESYFRIIGHLSYAREVGRWARPNSDSGIRST